MKMKVLNTGTGATTGAASAQIAIPNDSTGNAARTVAVAVSGTTYVQPGSSAVTATTGSMIATIGKPLILDVMGLTHIAHLELTAAQRITVTPLES
tara:strand:- start:3209 stop:3496 length:288 start_codon:yes stop_codon:yes gene_type:complete